MKKKEVFETIYLDGKKPKYDALIQVFTTKEFKKELQKTLIDTGDTLSDIVRDYLEKYVKKHSMNPVKATLDKSRKKIIRKKKSV